MSAEITPLEPHGRTHRSDAFAHLDSADLGWFHLRAVLVSGIGFFTDAYDMFITTLTIPMIYSVYYDSDDIENRYPVVDGLVKASANIGNLVGQLAFGYLGDKLGRKKMYGMELIIMILCTIGSALSYPLFSGSVSVLPVFAFWRFLVGVGIGGDYPMSAVITSEFASVRHRGLMLAAVFSMQGIGYLFSGIVVLVMLLMFRDALHQDPKALDHVWRISVVAGIVPALAALYFRLTIPETPRFTVDVVGDQDKAERDVDTVLRMNNRQNFDSTYEISATEAVAEHQSATRSSNKPHASDWQEFVSYFGDPLRLRILVGVAYSWFALDIAWYGLSLNSGTILSAINYNGINSAPVFDNFYNKATGQILINLMGTVPGYWATVALVDSIGRKPIQYTGFAVISVCLGTLALGWHWFRSNIPAFIIVYTIGQFFFNFGPNSTTFIVPSELFSTRWRSTGHGIAAASGKLGAILGLVVVGPNFARYPQLSLLIFSVIMATGILSTTLIPETMGKTLEELAFDAPPFHGIDMHTLHMDHDADDTQLLHPESSRPSLLGRLAHAVSDQSDSVSVDVHDTNSSFELQPLQRH